MGHVRATGSTPQSHAMWIFLGVGLDRRRHPTIGISLAQDRIHGGSHDGLIASYNVPFLVRGWFRGI